ncbi:MAG: hypothetical protein ACTSRZ_01810 [Promethearchaeota archaeon]
MERDKILSQKIIVIDNGTGFIKSGFAGDDKPISIIPTIIGYPVYKDGLSSIDYFSKPFYIGKEAEQHKNDLKVIFPIEKGIINDWEGMEEIWRFIFYEELKAEPSEHRVLITEPPLNPSKNRERMAEIMFEEFNVPSLIIGTQGSLALYAAGLDTGCVVNIGHDITNIVPVYQNFILSHAISKFNIGGYDITTFLQNLFRKKRYNIPIDSEKEIADEIKNNFCSVSLDPLPIDIQDIKDLELNKEILYRNKNSEGEATYIKEIFNGTKSTEIKIKIGNERFIAPECLFKPALIGKEFEPLDDAIFNTIKACDVDLRKHLLSKIILTGGTAKMPGLKERLTKEIQEQQDASVKVKIITFPEPIYVDWIGASILGSTIFAKNLWISKKEYKELGAAAINKNI